MSRGRTSCRRAGSLAVAAAVLFSSPLRAQEHQHGAGREQFQIQPQRAGRPIARPSTACSTRRSGARRRSSTPSRSRSRRTARRRPSAPKCGCSTTPNSSTSRVHAFDSEPDRRSSRPRCGATRRACSTKTTSRSSSTRSATRRSGYMFVTNPLGAKLEQQIFEEGGGNARGAVVEHQPRLERRLGRRRAADERRLDGRDRDPDGDAPLAGRDGADLGHQLHAQHPPQERAGLLGADSRSRTA